MDVNHYLDVQFPSAERGLHQTATERHQGVQRGQRQGRGLQKKSAHEVLLSFKDLDKPQLFTYIHRHVDTSSCHDAYTGWWRFGGVPATHSP